ncbi:MAG TPA: DUF1592 domain-containing protein, partial [Chthoniobacteraceae bacterium]|nr:DUF1592 domain-containing protein [Chthoniobacteraceae bacterium]
HKGDLDLVKIVGSTNLLEHHEVWEKVVEALDSGDMPPEKKPQPAPAQREMLLGFIGGQLSNVDCKLGFNPGKVTIRRLNREEYRNTIRDLLLVDFQPDDFPNDEVGYGFDNIADVLSLPPLLMEKFMNAAEEIAKKAIVLDAAPKPRVMRLAGDRFKTDSEANRPLEDHTLGLFREGEGVAEFTFPVKAEYTFRIRAFGEQAGPELPKMAFRIGGKEVRVFEVKAVERSATYEVSAPLEAGAQKIAIAYLNNFNSDGDRNLFVEAVEILGPPETPNVKLPESHTRLIPRLPEPGREREMARGILTEFACRAYRRQATPDEVERLVGFVELAMKNKAGFLEGIQLAIQAALCSPRFLFRWELDPDKMKPGDIRDLTDYEVASRLSYFLWSSMPDQELFDLAASGELLQNGNLEKQVARMSKDPKARALVHNFAGQWLQIRNMYEVSIDPALFPRWDDSLKPLMEQETERFVETIMKEDRPVTDLIGADFTFLNEKLARYYGIDGVRGDDFRRVSLPPGSARGGVLTQGSVLLATSTPTRTSPVIRGKWILEQILGTPPPPPPPEVPPLKEQKPADQSAALRQRLEQHRIDPACAGCHELMDPLGFALENFDATGAWRDKDGRFAIDPSGKLRGDDGQSFNGPQELKALLKNNKKFVRCLTEKMMTYALGRGLEYYDKCAVKKIAEELPAAEHRFSALLTGIVTSDPFLKRKREVAEN